MNKINQITKITLLPANLPDVWATDKVVQGSSIANNELTHIYHLAKEQGGQRVLNSGTTARYIKTQRRPGLFKNRSLLRRSRKKDGTG